MMHDYIYLGNVHSQAFLCRIANSIVPMRNCEKQKPDTLDWLIITSPAISRITASQELPNVQFLSADIRGPMINQQVGNELRTLSADQ